MTIHITCKADRTGLTDQDLDRAIAYFQEHGEPCAWQARIHYNTSDLLVTLNGKEANQLSEGIPLAQALANKIINQAFERMLAIKKV